MTGQSIRFNLKTLAGIGAITAILMLLPLMPAALAADQCVDLFSTNSTPTSPSYVFKDDYTPPEELRQVLTRDLKKIEEARIQVKALVRAAYKHITKKSNQVWEKWQADPSQRSYDVVVVGLGPTGSAAISKIVTEFRKQHGRNPRVLIVGDKVGGTYWQGLFYLNTAYTFAPSLIGEGPKVSVWGFSPHRGIGAIDPLELELGINIFSDSQVHSLGESQVSRSNAVNGSVNIVDSQIASEAILQAQSNGEIHLIRKTGGTSSSANVLLNPTLNRLTAINVMFQPGTSIANAVAVELARLGVDVVESAYVTEDRGTSERNRLTIVRNGREIQIDAKFVARFTGPGLDKNPFEPQSPSGKTATAAIQEGIDSRMTTTTQLQQQLSDAKTRDHVLDLMKDGVLFVGNGDSTLVTAEAVLGFVPGKDLYSSIPPKFREAMRTKFAISRMSPKIVEDLFQGNARKRRNGEDSVSRAPLIPDRYRRLLEFLRAIGQDPQQVHRLIDAYITEIKKTADGGYDVTFGNGTTKHFGFIVLGTGRAVDAIHQYSRPNSRFKPVKGKILDFFSSLSGRTITRTQSGFSGRGTPKPRPRPELTPEEIEAAPEYNIGLFDPVNNIFLGGFQAGPNQGVAEDMARGGDSIVSIGAREEIVVLNSAAMPYTLPRAVVAGTWIVEKMNELGLWSQ